jgi:uncharacterized protein (TIGR03435 family)
VKLCTALVFALVVWGQEPAPVFEVASIKPADPAENGTSYNTNAGGLRVTGANLRSLVMYAYNIRNFQLSGGPGWVYTDRFNILARSEHSPDEGPADFRKMTDAQRRAANELIRRRVQALLSERFQLVLRRESKEMPIYALVVAKGGVKMTEAKEGEGGSSMNTNNTRITCQRCTMESLAVNLSGITGRPVHDETGLTGKYDFKMEWAPEPKAGGAERGEGAPAEIASTPEGPTLFTALQQVLGLKLEPKKGPVDMYVIERAEKPSEN